MMNFSETLLKKTAWLCIPILFFITSCSEPKTDLTQYGPIFNEVMLSDAGVFRGANIGDSREAVKDLELTDPVESDSVYLYYEYATDTANIYNISYNFDERGLKEIQTEIYVMDVNEVEAIMDKFKLYFNNHYGASESQMGFNVWSVRSEKYNEIKISISDESTGFSGDKSIGKIALWIYPNSH